MSPGNVLAFRRRGARRVVTDDRHFHDVTLLDGLVRGFYWQHLIDTCAMRSGTEFARAEGLDCSIVNEFLRLTLLAPAVVEQLVGTTETALEQLMRCPWPTSWKDQDQGARAPDVNRHPCTSSCHSQPGTTPTLALWAKKANR